jgi:hypothetical protein
MEAVAKHDFKPEPSEADDELSFKKGDILKASPVVYATYIRLECGFCKKGT